MSKLVAALCLAAPFTLAQNTQVGGMLGRGGAVQLFENSAYHFVAGAEGCFLCGGRFGVYAEYHHWKKTGEGTDSPVSLDLAGGGLRIQGRGRRVRPFFDVGVAAGMESRYLGKSRPVTGGVLGTGAMILLGEHPYIRPLLRITGLSSGEAGGFAGASIGYRF